MSQPLYIPTCYHRWYLHITEKPVTSLPSDEFLCAWKPSAANSAIAYAFDYCLCSMTMFQAKDSRGPTILQHSVLDPTILFWVSSHETPLTTPSHTMVHQEGSYISLLHRDLATSFTGSVTPLELCSVRHCTFQKLLFYWRQQQT